MGYVQWWTYSKQKVGFLITFIVDSSKGFDEDMNQLPLTINELTPTNELYVQALTFMPVWSIGTLTQDSGIKQYLSRKGVLAGIFYNLLILELSTRFISKFS